MEDECDSCTLDPLSKGLWRKSRVEELVVVNPELGVLVGFGFGHFLAYPQGKGLTKEFMQTPMVTY